MLQSRRSCNARPDAGKAAEGKPHGVRRLNNLLGEATNMIWGSFRTATSVRPTGMPGLMRTQVPIIINHRRNTISFGSEDPQLCLKYTLRQHDAPAAASVPLLPSALSSTSAGLRTISRENPSVGRWSVHELGCSETAFAVRFQHDSGRNMAQILVVDDSSTVRNEVCDFRANGGGDAGHRQARRAGKTQRPTGHPGSSYPM